jgi:hypothetical protein
MEKKCNIIGMSARAPTEEKSEYSDDSCREELKRGFSHFPKYHIKILSGECNTSLRRKGI